jgi:hypothetical protein
MFRITAALKTLTTIVFVAILPLCGGARRTIYQGAEGDVRGLASLNRRRIFPLTGEFFNYNVVIAKAIHFLHDF